jgi:hypothetical protein
MEKPMYKEKIRVRSYGLAENNDSKVYLEIKKKFDGVGMQGGGTRGGGRR